MKKELNIIFENDDLLAINKASGMVVNKSQTVKDELTIQDLVQDKIKSAKKEDETSEFQKRGGVVHRLDRETSGVLLIAKNEDSFNYLQNLFKERDIKKEYLALAIGHIPDDVFEIDAPIGRNPKNRFKFAVVREEKEAQTMFEKIEEIEIDKHPFTWLRCLPRTGRTHQIRVHLTAYGHCIAGDQIYSSLREKEMCSNLGIERLMLHALKLSFIDKNGVELYLEAPIPEELSKFM
jgi:23S rRNA pseudouridine1911/1915/1917 synthase